jgi:hypothetical protein
MKKLLTITTLGFALFAAAATLAQAEAPPPDYTVFVDPPTGFVFIKLPQGWKFAGRVSEADVARLPFGVVTSLLRTDPMEPPAPNTARLADDSPRR